MTAQPLKSFRDLGSDGSHRFKQVTEEYASALKAIGISFTPYDDPALPLFAAASRETQFRAIDFFESALGIFDEIQSQGGNITDSRSLIWRTLSRFRLVPDASIFDKMGDTDVVEIYSLPENFHMAWNVRLVEQVSFTAEQLLCVPWWELGSRPPDIMAELHQIAIGLASNKITETVENPVKRHVVQEHGSHELLTIEIQVKYISPLKRGKVNYAFMVINDCRVVGSLRGAAPG